MPEALLFLGGIVALLCVVEWVRIKLFNESDDEE